MKKKEFKEGRNLYIDRRENGMHSLFAIKGFYANSPIIYIKDGDKQDEGDLYTIEIDEGHFFHPYGRYTNHSCDPTAYVDRKSGYLFSKRELFEDEEITFDYLSTERSIKANFICNCGSDNCVGKIGTDK